jgi:hypothetical protein
MMETLGTLIGGATARAEALAVAIVRPFARRALALVLAEIDLTELVRDNVDLDSLMTTVDLDAIVERINIADVAERVLQTVDIAAIIRDSTESVTSEVVQGVRLRGADADVAVGRVVDRLLGRRPHPAI